MRTLQICNPRNSGAVIQLAQESFLVRGERLLTLILVMTGPHTWKHSGGTMTCRACRPDPCRWKGASNAAKDPAGDDAATATAMSGAASIAQDRAIIIEVGDVGGGQKWDAL